MSNIIEFEIDIHELNGFRFEGVHANVTINLIDTNMADCTIEDDAGLRHETLRASELQALIDSIDLIRLAPVKN